MRLLFNNNLSHRLITELADIYPIHLTSGTGLKSPSQLVFVSSMAISQADRIAVFGPVGFPVIALRFRRGVLVGILN